VTRHLSFTIIEEKSCIIIVSNEDRKEKYDNHNYSRLEIDRNRIIEIVAKSVKTLYQFEIKEEKELQKITTLDGLK
jgi:hypothetical protein